VREHAIDAQPVEQARDIYGVVIEAGALDDVATDELRARMRDGGTKGEGS